MSLALVAVLALTNQPQDDGNWHVLRKPGNISTVTRRLRGTGQRNSWVGEGMEPRDFIITYQVPRDNSTASKAVRKEIEEMTSRFFAERKDHRRDPDGLCILRVDCWMSGPSIYSFVERTSDGTTMWQGYFRPHHFLFRNGRLSRFALGSILLPSAHGALDEILRQRLDRIRESKGDTGRQDAFWTTGGPGDAGKGNLWVLEARGIAFFFIGYKYVEATLMEWKDLAGLLNLSAAPLNVPLTREGKSAREIIQSLDKQQP